MHAIKLQSVVAPNGPFADLIGPVEGRTHDNSMLATLVQHSIKKNGNPYIYWDPAYPLRIQLQAPFRNNVHITPMQQEYNKAMSKVRISEWVFGEILNYFAFLDFKKNLKIQLSAVGRFLVSAILTNARTCLYQSMASDLFDIEPLLLEEYFT